jgi:hypothetical protein
MTRRVVTNFEDPVTISTTAERLEGEASRASIYQKALPLVPGKYRLHLVVKDIVGETMSTHRLALDVPAFNDEKLAVSTLILADRIEKVPTRSLGTGQFVLGSSKVRPRMGDAFKQNEKMGIYLEIYNLGENQDTETVSGDVTYQIARLDNKDDLLLDFSEQLDQIRGASPREVTIEKILPLSTLDPGEYQLNLKIRDSVRNEVLNSSKTFKIQ